MHIFRDFVKLKLRPLEMSHEGDIKMYEQALVNKVGIEADIAKGIAKIQRGVAIKRSWVGERREQVCLYPIEVTRERDEHLSSRGNPLCT